MMSGAHEEAGRAFLRHTLATFAYRGAKVLRGAPPGFAGFRIGAASRSASEILAHIGDLMDWALALARGAHVWHDSPPRSWDDDVMRLFDAVAAFDAHLASDIPLGCPPERLFQGPVADALTHVGQLAMMRRLAGAPVKGENYYKAEIRAGRVGADQAPARAEFA